MARKILSNLVLLVALLVGSAMYLKLGWAQDSEVSQVSVRQAVSLLREADDLLQRRDFAAAAEKAAQAGKLAGDQAQLLQRGAEVLFLSGKAAESLPLFERVIELLPEAAAQNWQRGIALCSCGKFEEGAKQFETHQSVNPDDVENSAWYFLCIAKTQGIEAARKTVIPSRGDGRQPMMSVLELLQQKRQPDEVLTAAVENTSPGAARQRAQFYAALYVGLYYDSLGDTAQAVRYLKQSLEYGDSGYMVDAARVYLADRFAGGDNQSLPSAK